MIPLKTQNIIFDLGGVILNLDHGATARAFESVGLKDFISRCSYTKQSELFDLFEQGKVSAQEFRQRIQAELGAEVEPSDFDRAWNAMLLDIPKTRLDALKRASEKYRIFLLSNTNAIHIEYLNRYVKAEHDLPHLGVLFEKAYLSYEMGCRKPHVEIYQQVLADSKLDASVTTFIDDNGPNIEGAKKAGINTIHLTPDLEIARIF